MPRNFTGPHHNPHPHRGGNWPRGRKSGPLKTSAPTQDVNSGTSHVENLVTIVMYIVPSSAVSVSIPPVRHALVATVESKYRNCRHSNVRMCGIRDTNVTFYMGINLGFSQDA